MKKKTEKKKSTKTRTVANRLDIIENVLKQIQERLYGKPRWSDRNCKCALDLPIPAWKAPTFQSGNRAHGEMPGAMDYSRYMKAVQECINSGSEVDRLNKMINDERVKYSRVLKSAAEMQEENEKLRLKNGKLEKQVTNFNTLAIDRYTEILQLKKEIEDLKSVSDTHAVEQMQDRIDKLCKVLEYKQEGIETMNEEIKRLRGVLKTSASINGAIGKDNLSKGEEIDLLKQEITVLRDHETALIERGVALEKSLEQIMETVDRVRKERDEADKKIKKLENRIARLDYFVVAAEE